MLARVVMIYQDAVRTGCGTYMTGMGQDMWVVMAGTWCGSVCERDAGGVQGMSVRGMMHQWGHDALVGAVTHWWGP